jgi:hypothetical protein
VLLQPSFFIILSFQDLLDEETQKFDQQQDRNDEAAAQEPYSALNLVAIEKHMVSGVNREDRVVDQYHADLLDVQIAEVSKNPGAHMNQEVQDPYFFLIS